jgi:hypothetical protein
MKTLKSITAIAAFVASVFVSMSAIAENRDSIIVQFGGNSKMVIQTKDKAGITKIKKYDLNKIVRDMATELDSNTRDVSIIINEKNGAKYKRDTVFTFRSDTVETKSNDDINVSFKDGRIVIVDKEGRRRTVTIGGKGGQGGNGGPNGKDGEDGKDGSTNGNDRKSSDENNEDKDNDNDDDSDANITVTRKSSIKNPRKGFNINWGMNVYGQNNPGKYNTQDYDLRKSSLRYISLGWVRGATIAKGENAAMSIDFGIDFSWYNLMFNGNNTVKTTTNGNADFPVFLADGKPIELEKSKLTAPFVNISLMPTVAFRSSPLQYISAGIYAGYRIGGYTKTKIAGSGRKEKLKDDYGMNDFRYGIGAEVGLRNFPDLFVNYDLTDLFQTNKGPAIRMVSFGIRL